MPYLEFEAVLREPATASATPVETTGGKAVNREQLTVEMAGRVNKQRHTSNVKERHI